MQRLTRVETTYRSFPSYKAFTFAFYLKIWQFPMYPESKVMLTLRAWVSLCFVGGRQSLRMRNGWGSRFFAVDFKIHIFFVLLQSESNTLKQIKMSKFIQEFKDFAVKGNLIDMAVGIIIGGAFGKIVTSLVNDIIMPPIGWLVGDMNFSDLSVVLRDAKLDEAGNEVAAAITLNYGNFIQVILDFLIVALCIFFVIKAINRLKNGVGKKKEEEAAAPAPEPEPTKEEKLLTEIRDILKNK